MLRQISPQQHKYSRQMLRQICAQAQYTMHHTQLPTRCSCNSARTTRIGERNNNARKSRSHPCISCYIVVIDQKRQIFHHQTFGLLDNCPVGSNKCTFCNISFCLIVNHVKCPFMYEMSFYIWNVLLYMKCPFLYEMYFYIWNIFPLIRNVI